MRAAVIAGWPRPENRARRDDLTPLKPRIELLNRLWHQKRPLWVTLALFFLVGFLLILLTSGFFHEVGVALLISALLGFSIDFYLRRNIARDAFEGAMGYFCRMTSKRLCGT